MEGKVRWGPNQRKEARASGSPRGVNGGGVSVESGGKRGGETLIARNGLRWSPEEGGARGAVGVTWERREEKRALVPFVPKQLTRRGGGKGDGGPAQA
jgi:hypothetical protein